MAKHSTIIRLVLIAFSAFCSAHAQTLGIYNFPADITDVPTAEHATFTPLAGVNTSVTRLSSGQASISNWVTSDSAPDTSEYVSFTLQANDSYALDLTSLSFKSSRSSTGPAYFSVALFIDGVLRETSESFESSSTSTTTSSMPEFLFNFDDTSDISATQLVEFRFYGWGGSSTAGTLRLDDITINGSVNAVPEPASFALLGGLAVIAFAATRRRHVV